MTDVPVSTEASTESSAEEHPLTGRDRALLRAVAAGRAEFGGGRVPVLLVDGLPCTDFGAAHRLVAAGLVAPPGEDRAPVALTAAGRRVLD